MAIIPDSGQSKGSAPSPPPPPSSSNSTLLSPHESLLPSTLPPSMDDDTATATAGAAVGVAPPQLTPGMLEDTDLFGAAAVANAPPEYTPSEAPPPSHSESLNDLALAMPDGAWPPNSPSAIDEAEEDALRAEEEQGGVAGLAKYFNVGGQGLSAASTAASFGFTAARYSTAISLNIAKRVTQAFVALPAFAIDGAMGNGVPDGQHGRSTVTASSTAHAAVGGLFDAISAVALGGIDLGNAVTNVGLGVAVSGVEGIRRALGSEVLRSLSAFNRLVKREWNSTSSTLPPGGIPRYSTLGVTQALTAWVCIQMVTREYYEARMLRELDEIDPEELRREQEAVDAAAAAERATEEKPDSAAAAAKHLDTTPGAPAFGSSHAGVRITSEDVLPGQEGDLIGAEIGHSDDAVSVVDSDRPPSPAFSVDMTQSSLPEPLSQREAIQGLRRYSKLVLGVYGGVALAWLGRLPPNLFTAAQEQLGSVTDGEAPTVPAPAAPPADGALLGDDAPSMSRTQDENEFLRAAAAMDLDDEELEEADREYARLEREEAAATNMPGGFGEAAGAATPDAAAAAPAVDAAAASTTDAAATTTTAAAPAGRATPQRQGTGVSYIDVLTGRHDAQLFNQLGGLEDGAAVEGSYAESDVNSSGVPVRSAPRPRTRVARASQPRYYVVVDHPARRVILVLRGSLSLGDIAIDLTCESVPFEFFPDHGRAPSSALYPTASDEKSGLASAEQADLDDVLPRDLVHEGMMETAKEIGEPGRPVHRAVARALRQHAGYNLEITGHSLGAGVAALLALMWASPETCLTIPSSGLPVGRRVHAFAFAVPCVMAANLAQRCERLITSFCYSYDLVSRLSLGSILDIRNAAAWLCYEDAQQAEVASSSSAVEGAAGSNPVRMTSIIKRAFQHQAGRLNSDPRAKADVETDLLAVRKTLEASMQHVHLFPPGNIIYAFAPKDLATGSQEERFFQLKHDGRREQVFGQLVASSSMLSSHMPSVVDFALHRLPLAPSHTN